MARRDIIVMGASLGGTEALTRLAAALPQDLPAAVLVVQHIYPDAPDLLTERLARVASLRTTAALDGEPVEPRRIYVAVPDHHLMIEDGRIRLSRGPKESHARPSIDVLFRSAAFSAGPRAIGVVLTGRLDDGTAGLWAIKDRGGIAIVQSPEEAPYPSMPRSALRHVEVDYTLQLADIPNILRSLTSESIELEERPMSDKLQIETRIALDHSALDEGVRRLGVASFYTCPECSGSMIAISEGSIRRFRCHTGHGYSERALGERRVLKAQETLWSALAQMEEVEVLLRETAGADAVRNTMNEQRADELRSLTLKLREILRDEVFMVESGGEPRVGSAPDR
jgi:two-component system chemotaxis response regulator CheB